MELSHFPTILLVKRLPKDLNENEIKDLLQYFGSTSVSVMSPNGHMKGCAFAEFSTHDEAEVAMKKLHQAALFGSRLVVQYSDKNYMPVKPPDPVPCVEAPKIQDTAKENQSSDSHQPDPALHYLYPPPTPHTLNNISHALIAVPQFYIQVLHLMNRMNLPPPFHHSTEKSIFEQSASGPPPLPSESESELESEEEIGETANKIEKDIFEEKRLATQAFLDKHMPVETTERKRKRQVSLDPPSKRPVTVPTPDPSPNIDLESVPLPTPLLTDTNFQEVDMDLDNDEDLTEVSAVSIEPLTEDVAVVRKDQESTMGTPNTSSCVGVDADERESSPLTLHRTQMKSKRLPAEELEKLSVFKKYSPGTPSSKLYVKNMNHKLIAESDLFKLFKPYFDAEKSNGTLSELEIKLMTKGQMKGQAFVSLPTIEAAEMALSDLHGYVLHDKAMAIMFAKSK